MKKQNYTLAPAEWDFRELDYLEPAQVAAAVRYEYSRTCKPVRDAMDKWLSKQIDTETIRQILPYLEERQTDGNTWSDELSCKIRDAAATVGLARPYASDSIVSVVMSNPHWPAALIVPQNKVACVGTEYCTALRRDLLSIRSMSTPSIQAWINTPPPAGWLAVLKHGFFLEIDFESNTAKKIKKVESLFHKWLVNEQKNHPIKPKKGRKTDCFEKLRWLAAYRLHKSGFSRVKAQAMLVQYAGKQSPTESSLLPYYGNSGWSDAISAAKAELKAFGKQQIANLR